MFDCWSATIWTTQRSYFFYTADMFTCHSVESTGVTVNNNNGSVRFISPDPPSQHKQYRPKWNSAIKRVLFKTAVFPTVTRLKVFEEKVLREVDLEMSSLFLTWTTATVSALHSNREPSFVHCRCPWLRRNKELFNKNTWRWGRSMHEWRELNVSVRGYCLDFAWSFHHSLHSFHFPENMSGMKSGAQLKDFL